MANFIHLLLLLRLLNLPIFRPPPSPPTTQKWVDTDDDSPFRFSDFNSSLASALPALAQEAPTTSSPHSASVLVTSTRSSAPAATSSLFRPPTPSPDASTTRSSAPAATSSLFRPPTPSADASTPSASSCTAMAPSPSPSPSASSSSPLSVRRTCRLNEPSASSGPSSALSLPACSTEALGDRPVPGVTTATTLFKLAGTSRRNYDVQVEFHGL